MAERLESTGHPGTGHDHDVVVAALSGCDQHNA
jgi:hypothetical protein